MGGRGLSMSTGDISSLFEAQQANRRFGGAGPGAASGPIWNGPPAQVNPLLTLLTNPL